MSAPASFTSREALSERRLQDPSKPAPQRKKRVIVTGGSGKLGRWMVREMVEHGWEVWNLDVAPPAASEAKVAKFMQVDLTDYGQVVAALTDVDSGYKGVDAVIHLAAIPSPSRAPNHVIFHTNIRQTYNIMEAARVLNITNLAIASSETVFGIPFYPHVPERLPITEDAQAPESSYSLAKLLGEKMGEQYTRWNPEAKIINIRLSNVMSPDQYIDFENWQDDPWIRAWNGFCYIDARDCAQAFRKAIESSLKGHHVFNIANADNTFRVPTADLMKKVFPNTKWEPETSDPREGGISIKKAREMLGFDPKYDWQTECEKLKKASK
ncbi:uncharacterized protein I303_108451 [Kwoniella dejecticola CBS 10117]|uniref:NAD-dependent epimerase/dehydratase domain-containing protein n=1 Tax=Kwoniella dejecticola CBS 10117 TaxID=1296121 RepID=A0A1A5ZXD4_9TREE|nr:uncharacterized protein I303_07224 [Kwoniella dejecticola CBS 10117]OBR82464.1 hypothetical protein I303_07224 [Kwoniella dejecticola CBS 10117]